jgi:hypothetical protein
MQLQHTHRKSHGICENNASWMMVQGAEEVVKLVESVGLCGGGRGWVMALWVLWETEG